MNVSAMRPEVFFTLELNFKSCSGNGNSDVFTYPFASDMMALMEGMVFFKLSYTPFAVKSMA